MHDLVASVPQRDHFIALSFANGDAPNLCILGRHSSLVHSCCPSSNDRREPYFVQSSYRPTPT